jgi:hypothetical protein
MFCVHPSLSFSVVVVNFFGGELGTSIENEPKILLKREKQEGKGGRERPYNLFLKLLLLLTV